ncbi:MAG: polysaccharide deacetylase family protein [Verrucomicrobiota bacterium]
MRLFAAWAVCLLLGWPGLLGCQRQPAPFKPAVDPGETIYFVPVREKVIALTFDDGPNEPATGLILDALKRYQVKATFFLIGANVERYPETARRIKAEGHLIGNHTARHSRFDQSTASAIAQDIADGQRAIETVTGVTPLWFRPPYGISGPGMEEACRAQGLAIAGWSADANDWNPHPVEKLVASIVSQATSGDILLLHDGWETRPGADRQNTVEAVPLILAKLKAQGFRFVTVPDLLRVAGCPVAEFKNGARLLGLQIPAQPLPPGEGFWVRYFWDVPSGWDNLTSEVFVHYTTPDGSMQFQDDHEIPRLGDVRDRVLKHLVIVPRKAPLGRYQVRFGLFNPQIRDWRHRVPVRSTFRQKQGAVIIPDVLDVNQAAKP